MIFFFLFFFYFFSRLCSAFHHLHPVLLFVSMTYTWQWHICVVLVGTVHDMPACTHTRTHARTHTRTHAHTHARTHARTRTCIRRGTCHCLGFSYSKLMVSPKANIPYTYEVTHKFRSSIIESKQCDGELQYCCAFRLCNSAAMSVCASVA